jgi:hypothetical protein
MKSPHLINGFNSAHHLASSPQVNPSDNAKLENKHFEGERVSHVLRSASDARIVQGLADRIFACSERENFFTAEDLHSSETGELFNGKGSLWTCNSRICPTCIAKLSRRSRAISRYIHDNEKVLVGERWFFLTFTMPDLALMEFPLLLCRSVINQAWRKFSRSAWFGRVIRGGMKSEEFTVGNYQQYHYHIHSLAICQNRITSNHFVEIRREWTKALQFSFKKHDVEFKCETRDGLANVRVDKIYSKGKVISELCKYFTKSDSWAKMPPEQLADIATVARFPRMFEVFGACKETARICEANRKGKTFKEETSANSPDVNSERESDGDAYFNKKNITVRNSDSKIVHLHSPPKKRLSWRIRCRILSRSDWLKSLEEEISDCREYRKQQLKYRYAFATFQTLGGEKF